MKVHKCPRYFFLIVLQTISMFPLRKPLDVSAPEVKTKVMCTCAAVMATGTIPVAAHEVGCVWMLRREKIHKIY